MYDWLRLLALSLHIDFVLLYVVRVLIGFALKNSKINITKRNSSKTHWIDGLISLLYHYFFIFFYLLLFIACFYVHNAAQSSSD